MSHMLEIPDPLYAALEEAASAAGTTPLGWIAANLPRPSSSSQADRASGSSETLADFLEGYIGVIDGSSEPLSENPRELFTEYLEEKRRAGRL